VAKRNKSTPTSSESNARAAANEPQRVQRKPTIEALQESEERVRAIFNQAAVGIAVADLDGRFNEVNDRFLEIVGYTESDLQKLTFLDITHPSDRDISRQRSVELLQGNDSRYAYEKRFQRKDGSSVWTLTTVSLLKDIAGKPKQFIGIIEDISERKHSEEAAQARQHELSLIFANVSDAIFYLAAEPDGRFRILSVNPAFSQVTGFEKEKVVGRLVADVLPEPARSMALRNYETSIREKRTVRWEETTQYPSGRKSGLASVSPIFDENGKCISLIETIHDITERQRDEKARAQLAAVVESSDDAIITKTLDGIITTWNAGAQRIFGYVAEEVVGKPVSILMPPERVDEEPGILQRLRRGERIHHYETVRRRKDGTLLDISLSISPMRDGSGKLVGASKIARDITASKRDEQRLRDETRVLELLNTTGTMIASQLELNKLVQSVTDAATQLSGAQFGAFFYKVTDDRGEAFSLFALSGAPRNAFERFGRPGDSPIFEQTLRGKGIVRSDDITADSRYGKIAPHAGLSAEHPLIRSYLAVPVISRSTREIGALVFGHQEKGVFTERTERIIQGVAAQAAVAIDNAQLYEQVKLSAAERERLLNAERIARAEVERVSLLKDEFLATLSHELRTPLNAILGWSQILRTHDHGDEEINEGLSVIERSTRVQAQLIEDLLDMSRIISGKIRLDVQQVDVEEVVKSAIASVRLSAEAKAIRIQQVLDPLARPVRGDPGRLQQCFWNLLSNAIKFTPRGGIIQVTLERVNSHLEVCVSDNGQGIKPDFLPHIFERFRQADASTTRRHGGLGLGLSIVKSLVELHGGKVRARSPGEGRGSTFCIELPMMILDSDQHLHKRIHPRSAGFSGAWLDQPSLAGITVLAVDDEQDARNLLKRVLEECGARVVVAASSQQGLDLLKTERPDMIISDIGMPEEDGYEFIRKVRALEAERGGRTPAAALTAFARAEDRTRALRAGYQTHVAKPVEPTELAAVVASLATRK
jgi:PAS domain S-box-containing protein